MLWVSVSAQMYYKWGINGVPKDQRIPLWPIVFGSMRQPSAEMWYSNLKSEALGICHGLERFHQYCFTCEVSMITDYKQLVLMFRKDTANLSQRLQRILLYLNQYNTGILYKLGPQLSIAHLLSRYSHQLNKDLEISRMSISINTVEKYTNTLECMRSDEMNLEHVENKHIDVLSNYVLCCLPSTK